MAKFTKPHHMRGTIDGITYYSMNGKSYARKKSSLDADRIKTDSKFETFRISGGKFGSSSKFAMYLRSCLAPFPKLFGDNRQHQRLTSLLTTLRTANPHCFESDFPDYVSLAGPLIAFEFNTAYTFDGAVALEVDSYHNQERDDIRLELVATSPRVFRLANSSTYLRVHLIVAPIRPVGQASKASSGHNLERQSTWSSPWLAADSSLRLCEVIPIPAFMRQGFPLAVALAIEPGFEGNPEPLPALKGRAMRLLAILPHPTK